MKYFYKMNLKNLITTCLLFFGMIHNAENKKTNCVTLHTGRYIGCEYLCEMCLSELDTSNFYFENGACKNCNGKTSDDIEYTCCINTQIM